MFIVAQAPDFGTYHPFYKQSSRSWFDFLAWRRCTSAQFALECFFRGFIPARSGAASAWAPSSRCVLYCMIHFGKPYLEGVARSSRASRLARSR